MAPADRGGPIGGGRQEPTVARRAGVRLGPQPGAGELPLANRARSANRGEVVARRHHFTRPRTEVGWPRTVWPHPSEAGPRPVNMLATPDHRRARSDHG